MSRSATSAWLHPWCYWSPRSSKTEIFLKTPAVTQESLAANPFGAVGGGVSGAQAAAGTVDFDGDERSAIEKLKDERRAAEGGGRGRQRALRGRPRHVDGLTSETGRAINGEAGTPCARGGERALGGAARQPERAHLQPEEREP